MKPNQLILRCYAEKKGDQWQAFCIDLSLAAQADSFHAVRRKLNDMTLEYVYDALAGQDKDFAAELLQRKAPLKYRAKFHIIRALIKFGILRDGMKRLFCPPMPLEPQHYKHA